MANSKAISIRIPDELLEKIDLLAEEKYKSHKGTPNRSLVILDFIVTQLATLSDTNDCQNAISVSGSVSIFDFDELRDIVKTLADSVNQLKKELTSLSDSIRQSDEISKFNQEDNVIPSHTQLSTNLVSDSVLGEGSTSDSLNMEILSGQELAEKLKIPPSKLSPERAKGLNSFIDWTKSRKGNQDGAGWGFKDKPNGKGVIYYRVEPLA
jgi:metal-responsive CopG/Arc/MetJ family transcriptional regulator